MALMDQFGDSYERYREYCADFAREAVPYAIELPQVKHSQDTRTVGTCTLAEVRHSVVLNPFDELYRHGVVFVIDSHSLGYVKWYEDLNFVSWTDTTCNGRPVLEFGGLYGINQETIDHTNLAIIEPKKWGVVCIEDLLVERRRMVRGAPHFPELKDSLRREKELFEREHLSQISSKQ